MSDMPETVAEPKQRSYGGLSAVERQARRRAQLIEACLEVIRQGGLAGISIESVCAEAGLGKRYFYENFADRDTLLLAVADRLFETVALNIEADITGVDDLSERTRTIVQSLIRTLRDDPRLARLYIEAPGNPALLTRRNEATTGFSLAMVDWLMPQESPEFPDHRARELVARMIVAGTTDLVTQWLAGTVEAEEELIVDTIVALGLRAGAPFQPPRP